MSKYSPRSTPQQSRSQQRVDLILDTAANLFAEVGYETSTTNAIAEQAGISIGSLYRYFPDKDAILHALAARYHQEERELFDRVFTDDVIYLPLPVLLDRLIDPFLAMHCACPVYAHILLGTDISADIAAASRLTEQEFVERIASLLLRVAPHLEQQKASLVAIVCKAAVKSLISLRLSAPDDTLREQTTIEFKRMLQAYLQTIWRSDKV